MNAYTDNATDSPFDYLLGELKEEDMSAAEAMINEGAPAPKIVPNNIDTPVTVNLHVTPAGAQALEDANKSDELAIGQAGFIAICDADGQVFTIAAKTRRELRTKVSSLIASEAKKIEVLEIYRARRLELASQVVFKF